jgi:predicted Zn-dependent protease
MCPGFYVEGGRILGRVRDGMVAGNVYDVLARIDAVENRVHNPCGYVRYPSILLDGVSVSARG